MLYTRLSSLPPENWIRVGLIGAGSMGLGIANQLGATPGFILSFIVDQNLEAAEHAAQAYLQAASYNSCHNPMAVQRKKPIITDDYLGYLTSVSKPCDVLVEASSAITYAAEAVIKTLEHQIHVVLMNSEIDLLLGPLLHAIANQNGVYVTSDAGDQHGVLMRIIEEVRLMGCGIAMAGNIKGFLDRYATRETIWEEARIRRLNPVQCVGYTDGTKCNIEMALVANATGLVPACTGMRGPRVNHVSEVFETFDLTGTIGKGVVDYILGAEPGGGVFVVGYCDNPLQQFYFNYMKMGNGPFYLFCRPYHLCSMETPYAIARLYLTAEPILMPTYGKLTDVVAFAKRNLAAGTPITHAIGSNEFYGQIMVQHEIDTLGAVPITLLDFPTGEPARLVRDVKKDECLTIDHLEMLETTLTRRYVQQKEQYNSVVS